MQHEYISLLVASNAVVLVQNYSFSTNKINNLSVVLLYEMAVYLLPSDFQNSRVKLSHITQDRKDKIVISIFFIFICFCHWPDSVDFVAASDLFSQICVTRIQLSITCYKREWKHMKLAKLI